MKNEEWYSVFNKNEGQFDLEEPQTGHLERFQAKLNSFKQEEERIITLPKRQHWKMFVSIAASVVIILGVAGFIWKGDVFFNADMPPVVQQNQSYYASLEQQQLEEIKSKVTPETQKVVDDAMKQLKKLDDDYKQIEQQFQQDGSNKQLLHAMITNFQTRIDLLQSVLQQMEEVEQLKETSNENIS
ncbi:hypothetical protein ACG2LH_09245 [Zhouia sp. PK063]|uniref:hypothetical protein n=1 Tax=Zhouia sp. PK063 TaxID=3373602 RepID=UPI00379B9CC3